MAPYEDFFPLRRFRLELDGVAQGAFDEFDPPGLVTAVEVDEAGRRRPGLTSRTQARLLRGHANTRELHEWFRAVLQGVPVGRQVVVVELDDQGEETARHDLGASWPVRIRMAALTPELMIDVDELDLAVEGWTRSEVEPEPASGPSAAGPRHAAAEPAPAGAPAEDTAPSAATGPAPDPAAGRAEPGTPPADPPVPEPGPDGA